MGKFMIIRGVFRKLLAGGRTQDILVNFSWVAFDKILRLAVGLVVGVWVARYLGPSQYGELSYLLTLVSLFATFASLGMDNIVVRELSRSGADGAEILGSAFILRLAGAVSGVTLGLVSFLFIGQMRESGTTLLFLVISLSLLFASFDVIDFWFQSRLQMRYSVIGRNIGFLVGIAGRVAAILYGLSLFWFGAIYTAEIAAGACGLLLVYGLSGERILQWKVSIRRCVALIMQVRYLFLSALLIIVQARIDQIMLASLLGSKQLGLYAAALRLIEFFVFLPMLIHTVLVPVLSGDEFIDRRRHDEELLNVYRLMVLIFLPVGAVLIFFPAQLVGILYGPQYEGAAPLLALMSARLLLANFGIAKSLFFLRENAFGISLIGALLGCAINVGLNFALIPAWGAAGVVWASVISFFVTIFLVDLLFPATRRNFFLMVRALGTPWRFRAI
jgi:O-antigen/teichoic acid export membrane protein